jgi:polyhydroxybutyrate depolymerase
MSLQVGSDSRDYVFTVPPVHTAHTTTPIPLVIDLHGLFEGTVGVEPQMTQFSPKAIKEGFVVAYPTGSTAGIAWDTSQNAGNKDLTFIDTLISHFESTMCIDAKRIYVTGLSYGAFMTSALMCMRSTVFAAAAPVAGIQHECTSTPRKIPVVTFHGTADPILNFDDYKNTPQAWATQYGCGAATRTTVVANDPATMGPITKDTWNCSAQGTAVEFYTINGGGHAWPGSAFSTSIGVIVGPTATSINATDIIWDFFKRFKLP